MDFRKNISSQYRASLKMLRKAVEACPAELWADEKYGNRFWHIAYHTLFYTHLYLQQEEADFVPWEKTRPNHQFMGPLPWPPHDLPEIGEPYTKEELLQYCDLCHEQVGERLEALDPEGPSGFEWIPMNKLELQFYNVRHVQHHAGQLIERLRTVTGKGVEWVGLGEGLED
ncbi:MAG: DinB family protein [Planctomycetota bacterium]|jgi:hypothetical protein